MLLASIGTNGLLRVWMMEKFGADKSIEISQRVGAKHFQTENRLLRLWEVFAEV